MSGRKYYCFCDANCKFETMTKEQILAAIAQAAEGGLVFDADAAFVTKVKEGNGGKPLTFWLGTQGEFNALQEKDDNCFYIIKGAPTTAEISQAVISMKLNVASMQFDIDRLVDKEWSESGEQRNCYRLVDGTDGVETEWLNPPLEEGVVYRTAKRFFGKPVYATLKTVGVVAASTNTSFKVGAEGDVIDRVVTMTAHAYKENAMYPMPGFGSTGGNVMFSIRKTGTRTFYVHDHGSTGNFEVVVYLEYTLA